MNYRTAIHRIATETTPGSDHESIALKVAAWRFPALTIAQIWAAVEAERKSLAASSARIAFNAKFNRFRDYDDDKDEGVL